MGTITKIHRLLKNFAYYNSSEGKELRRIKRIPRYQTGYTKIFGFDFTFVDSASFVGQYIEIYTKKIYNFKSKDEQPYIIDCGANVGSSILFFKKIFPNANIVAFEPDKNIFPILKKNIHNSNYKQVSLINKAVWNKDGEMLFTEDGADGGSILDIPTENKHVSKIETTTLTPYLNKRVDLLKIDIEGAESAVLENCDKLLKNVDRIFIEYHSSLNKIQQLDAILQILTKNGFRYYIESATLSNNEPFIKRDIINNYDNLLSIHAYK